ncbi:MAG: AraC family transcriptional regulator [Spirochaetaceae bacterium]|nr:MAG: AraC family transcriptional regulator [Spirochaetaceae bacterium]
MPVQRRLFVCKSRIFLCNCPITAYFALEFRCGGAVHCLGAMKLLFFIRNIDLDNRTFGWEGAGGAWVHELVFCRTGHGELVGGRAKITVTTGNLLFNPKGRLVAREGPMTVAQVLFSEELFSPSVHMDREAFYVLGLIKLHSRKQNLIALSKAGAERTASLLDAMLWEFQNRYRGYSWAIRLKLIELLITLMRDSQFKISIKGLKPLSSSRIQDAVLYLNTDYMNKITVDDVLDACGLSRSHFHALFKQETGRTFVDYLSWLRCNRAAELLATTDSTILDIALDCGFNNLSHFYHVFKREKRVSPGRYRRHGSQERDAV